MIKLQMASLASLMFENDPMMWIFWSATTIRLFVAFSIAYLVFPSCPTTRPMARDKWSPASIFTSVTIKESMYKSSSLSKATASCTSKPIMNASTKSCPFWIAPGSSVSSDVFNSTDRVFGLKRICNLKNSTIGDMTRSHWFRRGVSRRGGQRILLYSIFPPYQQGHKQLQVRATFRLNGFKPAAH